MNITQLLLHLWRLILAVTINRNVTHERDDQIGEAKSLALPPPDVTPPSTPIALNIAAPQPGISVVSTPPDDHEPHVVVPTPPHEPADQGVLAPLKVDEHGWLVGDKVVRVPSKRGGYIWRTKSKRAGGILWHWTSTAWGTALSMARRIVDGPGTSVHCWIEYDGTIYQSVAFTGGSGHAGGPTAAHCKDVNGEITIVPNSESPYSINSYAIGIEIVNVGEVRLVKKGADGAYVKATAGDKNAVYMGWPYGRRDKTTGKVEKGPIVKDNQVRQGRDNDKIMRFFHDFTEAQVNAAERICRATRAAYGFSDKAMSWGHVDVDPQRRSDPGPLWQRGYLLGIFIRIDRQ